VPEGEPGMPSGSSVMKPREGSDSVYCFQVLPALIVSRMIESAVATRVVGLLLQSFTLPSQLLVPSISHQYCDRESWPLA
jgi:hypothetical protein